MLYLYGHLRTPIIPAKASIGYGSGDLGAIPSPSLALSRFAPLTVRFPMNVLSCLNNSPLFLWPRVLFSSLYLPGQVLSDHGPRLG